MALGMATLISWKNYDIIFQNWIVYDAAWSACMYV